MNGCNSSFGNGRKRSQRLLLLLTLALGMATVSVMLLHKLREARMFGLMLQDQDRQILTLQLILQGSAHLRAVLSMKFANSILSPWIIVSDHKAQREKKWSDSILMDRFIKTSSFIHISLTIAPNSIASKNPSPPCYCPRRRLLPLARPSPATSYLPPPSPTSPPLQPHILRRPRLLLLPPRPLPPLQPFAPLPADTNLCIYDRLSLRPSPLRHRPPQGINGLAIQLGIF